MQRKREAHVSTDPADVLALEIKDGNDLARIVRQAIIAELDAVNLYKQVADSIGDHGEFADIAKVFNDVADEEMVHAGEFMQCIELLIPYEVDQWSDGGDEVLEFVED